MNLKLEDLDINWDQKPSSHKLMQVKMLVDLLNNMDANKIDQLKLLNNFKKQAYTKKENFIFWEDIEANISIVKNDKPLKLFFNHVTPITETYTDYAPSATIILQNDQKIVLITTFSDFSNKKLRRRFTGYKYLKGNFDKFYIGPIYTLKNNGFKIAKISDIKFP